MEVKISHPFKKLSNRPNDPQTDRPGQGEASLQIRRLFGESKWDEELIKAARQLFYHIIYHIPGRILLWTDQSRRLGHLVFSKTSNSTSWTQTTQLHNYKTILQTNQPHRDLQRHLITTFLLNLHNQLTLYQPNWPSNQPSRLSTHPPTKPSIHYHLQSHRSILPPKPSTSLSSPTHPPTNQILQTHPSSHPYHHLSITNNLGNHQTIHLATNSFKSTTTKPTTIQPPTQPPITLPNLPNNLPSKLPNSRQPNNHLTTQQPLNHPTTTT